jgi:hypothetical protein
MMARSSKAGPMTQAAVERGEWQAVIDAHPLESHDPAEWLRYGAAAAGCAAGEGAQGQRSAVSFRCVDAGVDLVRASQHLVSTGGIGPTHISGP